MVAMDFFAALNCYDFLNQYCSNLMKNPTVRGLGRTTLAIDRESLILLEWTLTLNVRCVH